MDEHAGEFARADHGEVLNDLWSAERCTWRIEHHGGSGPWVVLLEWTQEYDNTHDADWVTFTWQFYGDTVDEALAGAVGWCERLWPWRRCDACDGLGWCGRMLDRKPCDECRQTGLAEAPHFGSPAALSREETQGG